MKKIFAAGLFAFAALAATICVPPQPGLAQAGQEAAPAGQPDEKAMMEMMAQMGSPGDEHKLLESFAGTWDTKVTSWMQPGAPPTESSGTSVNKMVLGGRWLHQEFNGEFGGMPFSGIGYTGYDKVKKKYVGLWMDNMGTQVMVSEGELDGSGKVMTCTAEMANPMTGGTMKMREVTTVIDKDHHKFEMYMSGPDGQEMKSMEIVYSRKS